MTETQTMMEHPIPNQTRPTHNGFLQAPRVADLTRKGVSGLIEKIGVVPALRLRLASEALFVVEALAAAGIPFVEVSTLEPGAVNIISHLARHAGVIVGAGSVFTAETARRCLDAGARFLVSDFFVPSVVELAARENIVVMSGALTPTEVMTAWAAGSDFVKVVPCGSNEHDYIRSLNMMMPQARLIAAGRINQHTAPNFIAAGASALSVGTDLVQPEAIFLRQHNRIQEMSRRFLNAVVAGREAAGMIA
jgi:2-dehydro-3-deoxyphosphogluconate aldolase / (4S)-4-hydroxy-2-oxoglutarate aldolase